MPIESSMSVEQARAVAWPFRTFKGQSIGSLLDNGSVSLKDLGFAIERAYDKRVRDASKTLLLHLLEHQQQEITIPAGPLNVISSDRRSFAERRQIQYAMLLGLVSGLVLGGLLLFLFQLVFFRPESNPESQQILVDLLSTPKGIFYFGLAIFILFGIPLILMWFSQWISDRLFDQIQNYRKGQLGEEQVLNALYHALDGNWWLFRNLELPARRNGDIDLVLVGTNGVWVLEVKTYSGEFRTVGDKWERLIGKRWLPTFTNPSTQVKRNAATLSQALSTHNIKQWITPAVIWANPDSKLIVENPAISIWHLYQVHDALNNIQAERTIPDEQRLKIIEIIKGFYKQPFSENG